MEKVYQSILSFQDLHPKLKSITIFICNYFPKIIACSYLCLLGYLFINKSPLLLSSISKPCFVFLFTGICRKLFSRCRPYEVYNITPLIQHKNGQSFPSRHMASAMIISFTIYSFHPLLAIPAFIISFCIGLSRFIAGIHFPSDILAGALFALLIYCI